MKKFDKNRIIAGISAGLIVLSGTAFTTYLQIKNFSKKEIANQKPYEYVLKDSESLNVDMSVANNFNEKRNNEKNYRLKFDDDKPVIVEYEETMEEREIGIIKNVVDYYNKIFSTINENYRFTVQKEGEKIDKGVSVISFENGTLTGGAKGREFTEKTALYQKEGVFVEKAKIVVDWETLEKRGDTYIFSIALHEFAHTLGLGDVYHEGDNKTSNYVDTTTLMQAKGKYNEVLYPSDYAILQALYSNEYAKHENYQDAVRIVDEKIEKYTKLFYKQYAEAIKEKTDATDCLAREKFVDTITWKSETHNICKIKLRENNKCEFYIEDQKGNVLEKAEGETVFVDGILFVKKIVLKDAGNYMWIDEDELEVGAKLTFNIYIDGSGMLVVNDRMMNNYAEFEYMKGNCR